MDDTVLDDEFTELFEAKPKRHRSKISEDDIARMIDMKKAGMQNNEIARSLGWCPATVSRQLKAHECELYDEGGGDDETEDVTANPEAINLKSDAPKGILTNLLEPLFAKETTEDNWKTPGSIRHMRLMLDGAYGYYEVDVTDQTLTFVPEDKIDGEDGIKKLMDELNWIRMTYFHG